MMDADDVANIKGWFELVRAAEERARETAEGRDMAIRRVLAAGAKIKEITDITGLSRARVYQIRDGRR